MNNPQEKKMQIRTYAGGVLTMAPTREKVQFLSWTFSFWENRFTRLNRSP